MRTAAAHRSPLEHMPVSNAVKALVAGAQEILVTWGPPLLLVLVVRSALAEPFRIPSGSMVPTLEIGDHIVVSKFAYGLRVPFTQVVVADMDEPARGDIIVFRYPPDPSQDYIKRIVGLPGDVVEVRNGTVLVNGVPAERERRGDFPFMDEDCRIEPQDMHLENLFGVEHWTLSSADRAGAWSNVLPTPVPAGEYFVMGDNRDNSADSRVWGTVPRENIKGRAFAVWLSVDFCDPVVQVPDLFTVPSVRTERLFKPLD